MTASHRLRGAKECDYADHVIGRRKNSVQTRDTTYFPRERGRRLQALFGFILVSSKTSKNLFILEGLELIRLLTTLHIGGHEGWG